MSKIDRICLELWKADKITLHEMVVIGSAVEDWKAPKIDTSYTKAQENLTKKI